MVGRLCSVSALCSALALLFASPPVAAQAPDQLEPVAPTTFLEFYEQAFECLYYFDHMNEGLKEREAPADEIARYEDMGFSFIWALSGFDSVLSNEELNNVSEAEISQKLAGYSDLDVLRGDYDTICVDLHDSWKQAD